MQNDSAVLRVKNLKKSYAGKRGITYEALRGVSFDIREGEIFGLLGPNGAGKSTTINILVGLLSEDSGSIEVFGKNFVEHHLWIRNQMNIATAYAQLPIRLSVAENLRVFSYFYRVHEREKRINDLIELFGITHLRNTQIGQLSAGQKTLVNICKSLLNEPRLLLLDEPTSSLDPENAAHVRTVLQKIQQERPMTILWTSHDMPEIEEVCDRIAFLLNGKIEVVDTPDHLLQLVTTQQMTLVFSSIALAEAASRIAWPKGIACVKHEHRTVTLVVPHKEGAVRQVLRILHEKKIDFLDMHIIRPALEEVFLTMAERQKRTV
ncbi:MAG: ABC transporter ATP-binding protein [bacterium]|nr:ABC transporter ATP-binding protein [bacterium]